MARNLLTNKGKYSIKAKPERPGDAKPARNLLTNKRKYSIKAKPERPGDAKPRTLI
jgi:hypothetical protein